MKHLCIAIVGPTASGKSSFAMALAEKLGGEIVCVDSTTVYQGFDIGTSKPSAEDRARVPHHLIDTLRPTDSFNAFDFVHQAEAAIEAIENRGKIPLLTGGTYFYFRALQHGMFPVPGTSEATLAEIEQEYMGEDGELSAAKMTEDLKAQDPDALKTIHPNDRYRLVRALAILKSTGQKPSTLKPVPLCARAKDRLWVKYSMAVSRHNLGQLIMRRTDQMLVAGLVAETRKIFHETPAASALGSIGYRETMKFIKGEIDEKAMRNEIIDKTRALAKRQTTWLRSDPEIRYVDDRDVDRVVYEVETLQSVLQQGKK